MLAALLRKAGVAPALLPLMAEPLSVAIQVCVVHAAPKRHLLLLV